MQCSAPTIGTRGCSTARLAPGSPVLRCWHVQRSQRLVAPASTCVGSGAGNNMWVCSSAGPSVTGRVQSRTHRGTLRSSAMLSHRKLTRSQCAAASRGYSTPAEPGQRVGVVIVDHGSRKRDSNDQLVHFGLMYQQMTGASVVEIAHMEIAEPTIDQAIGRCVAAGAQTIVVAPYFLSKGRHIQEDIPALVREAQGRHAGVQCVIADPIGVDPLMVQLISNRVRGALRQKEVAASLAGFN